MLIQVVLEHINIILLKGILTIFDAMQYGIRNILLVLFIPFELLILKTSTNHSKLFAN